MAIETLSKKCLDHHPDQDRNPDQDQNPEPSPNPDPAVSRENGVLRKSEADHRHEADLAADHVHALIVQFTNVVHHHGASQDHDRVVVPDLDHDVHGVIRRCHHVNDMLGIVTVHPLVNVLVSLG